MYDTIIIGTGPAGFSAAMNLKIHNKDFLWFGSKNMSSKVEKAEKIRNYPGLPEITGQELQAHFQHHAETMDIEIQEKMVTMIMKNGDSYMVLADNELYEAKTVLFATGVMAAKTLKGEDSFLGRGISYCATCDGALYKGKRIAVICNDARFEHEVAYLAELAGGAVDLLSPVPGQQYTGRQCDCFRRTAGKGGGGKPRGAPCASGWADPACGWHFYSPQRHRAGYAFKGTADGGRPHCGEPPYGNEPERVLCGGGLYRASLSVYKGGWRRKRSCAFHHRISGFPSVLTEEGLPADIETELI